MTTIRVVLAGLGNVGRGVLSILISQRDLLAARYGLEVLVVGASDSSGAALDPAGLDLGRLLALKSERGKVAEFPGGLPGLGGRHLIERARGDLLLEATPVNLQHGQPGLDTVRAALDHGMGCVLANKGPLALAYGELAAVSDLSDVDRPRLRFSACVGGALPTINLGRRDLAGARILGVEAMLNGTSQGILRAMEQGQGFAEALAEMQRRGIAETDPTLDVDGWDQAVKLVILANAVLGRPTVLGDLRVRGIREITRDDLAAAAARGERIVHLGRAERPAPTADWVLDVGPVSLPAAHPLARMGALEMGVIYRTDISGTLHATSEEGDAVPTAAAMLRDLIEISR
ncbi:MAG: homoserine dehydrogenase [Gemmatimonadetes bacterium]|nr:homoserine dehydrogenase [Gemmatimonadota bacterium]